MDWLPAIQWEQKAWLLPLSVSSANTLAAYLLDASSGNGPLADPEWAASVLAEALSKDPALAMFAALEYAAVELNQASIQLPSSIELEDLAAWLTGRLRAIFRDQQRRLLGDLVAGEVELARVLPDYQSLAAVALAGSPEQWMERAVAWLQPAEREPPAAWRQRWPRLLTATNESPAASESTAAPAALPDYAESSLDLYHLASALREREVLSERFAAKLQTEKLASLRQLAYGLSHEINNPLAGIRTRAEQLASDEEDAGRRQQLSRIVDSVMRAHEMIADLMYFARPPQPSCQTFSAEEFTRQLIAEYQPQCEQRGIQCELLEHPTTPGGEKLRGDKMRGGKMRGGKMRGRGGERLMISADPDQLADALRALLDNALEAVSAGGAIAVQVRRTPRFLMWVVSDSGPGLSVEARRHAFDPYFSGREAGRGLGLGLCRVYRIARSHGGGVSLDAVAVGCRARLWVRRTADRS